MDAVIVDGIGAAWNGLHGVQSMATVVTARRFGMVVLGAWRVGLDVDDKCKSAKLRPPVSNRDIDQSVLLLNGKCPLLDAPQSGAGTWQLATPSKLGSTSSPAAPRFPPEFAPK